MKWVSVAVFISGTAIAWGVYSPIVQIASQKLGSDLRTLVLVGLTYCIVGVLVPAVFIITDSDPTARAPRDGESVANFDASGVKWGLAAGLAGVAGSVCMIFALTKAGPGAAVYVAPVVFAAVPVVNTVAAIVWFSPVRTPPSWQFLLGLALAAAGAVLILTFRPDSPPVAEETGNSATTIARELD